MTTNPSATATKTALGGETALQPYPEYKDSGVPWLGDVPAHWELHRAKKLFERMQRPVRPKDETVTCFRDGTVTLRSNKRTDGFTESLKEIGYQGVREGDLVIHAMDAFAGAIGVSDSDGKCTPVYSVCRAVNDSNPYYYAYVIREMARTGYILALARGVRERSSDFRYGTFAAQHLPVPPVNEQNSITTFVKMVDRLTRRYIRAQRRLIKLLEEQKQALIQRAVTRGLDPHVPLKDSGVAWLGEIPEHWEIVALRYRYSIELGKMLDTKRITGEHLVPYLRNADVQWDHINVHNLPRMDIESHEYARYTLTLGDMLVCEGGEVGRSAFWKEELPVCGFQKALHRIRPHSLALDEPRFLYYVMWTAAKRGIFHADGSENTIAHLTGEKLRKYRFAFPQQEEQKAIALYLDSSVFAINNTINSTQRQIDLIVEYRTRLIADVVTGKLDVRGLALPEPEAWDDEPDEDEADEAPQDESEAAWQAHAHEEEENHDAF